MNEEKLKEIIEKIIRMNIICVDKEFSEGIDIPDDVTVHESWLANKILIALKDSGELKSSHNQHSPKSEDEDVTKNK